MTRERQDRYTLEELLRQGSAAGFAPTARLVTDWVSLGLLDRPQKKGLGRGRGTTATWPYEQMRLFLLLLDKRRGVKRIGTLCNIPVSFWLLWGDQYAPLRQVRRALATWSGRGRKRRGGTSLPASVNIARQIVGDLAHPDATQLARRNLRDELARCIHLQRVERDRLLKAAQPVFDPHHTGAPRGPVGAQVSAEGFVLDIEARVTASRELDGLEGEAFERARVAYRASIRGYVQEQPGFALDPDLGHLHRPLTLDFLANQACYSLMTLIGLDLLARRRHQDQDTG